MATLNDVRRIAMALPGVEEAPSYDGKPAWKVAKKLFVWERPLRKADREALGSKAPSQTPIAVRTADLEMKAAMLASEPAIFFTTPHFDGYPSVLVRLDKIGLKLLKQIILDAWLCRAPEKLAREFKS